MSCFPKGLSQILQDESILRKYGIRTTPRQLCSESGGKVLRDLPLYPFGCKVDFVNNVSKLKTTGRGDSTPPSFGTNEAPALPYPPPSPLRWLRHPSAVRRPSFWHL
jgi:hypothetical protein